MATAEAATFQDILNGSRMVTWSTDTELSRRRRQSQPVSSRAVRRMQRVATPIDPSGWPDRFPAKDHCSKCGLCETSFGIQRVVESCAFLNDGMSRIDTLEANVHGRRRDPQLTWSIDNRSKARAVDEARFGVMHEPMKLARGVGMEDAQWTGIVTSIAVAMLEAGEVDAVVCIASDSQGEDDTGRSTRLWSSPKPILAKTKEQILEGRGVKPALAPSLNVLDLIRSDSSIRRLLFCGVGCSVQAFRAVQNDLIRESKHLQEVFVLGTNCVDNSPTPAAADKFLTEGVKIDSSLVGNPRGYEFMQDFRVHVKTDSGAYVTKPYFCLPGTIAESSIATSCLACTDYCNALTDVTVGYMGAPLSYDNREGNIPRMDQSLQTLTIRNPRGAKMVQLAIDAGRLEIMGDVPKSDNGIGHEKMAIQTVTADSIVLAMIGGTVPEEGMPQWLGEALALVIRRFVAPKGINFARYSIDYHILRNYLHMVDAWGEERARESMPQFARDVVDHYVETQAEMANLVSKVKRNRF